eukprot:1041820-Rhodomonas_salina.3
MTEEEYDAQLEAVAWFITEWGKADYLRNEIATTDQSPGNRRVFQRDIRGEFESEREGKGSDDQAGFDRGADRYDVRHRVKLDGSAGT